MKQHILVVDDEEDIRDLLKLAITGAGYRVTTASSAVDALEISRSDPPDLIISDLQLGDSDGLEMISQLRVLLPGRPVMLLTGVLFDAQVITDVLLDKVSCYLPKTSPLAMILEAVHQLLRPPAAR